MEKLLVKDRHGKVPEMPENMRASVQEAKDALSTAQYDRYCRAKKVWFVSKTKTFEFEDTLA